MRPLFRKADSFPFPPGVSRIRRRDADDSDRDGRAPQSLLNRWLTPPPPAGKIPLSPRPPFPPVKSVFQKYLWRSCGGAGRLASLLLGYRFSIEYAPSSRLAIHPAALAIPCRAIFKTRSKFPVPGCSSMRSLRSLWSTTSRSRFPRSPLQNH